MPQHTKVRARAGFTLLEMMVSLTVGGIALGSIYAVGAASTRHFREQQRISTAQTSLRSAMTTLKHDFQRAGYMSTPDSRRLGQACASPAWAENGWIGAVNGYAKNVNKPTKLDPDELMKDVKDPRDQTEFFSVDDVWLTGNYATSGEYANISVDPDGTTIRIPMGWQSFQRDFSEWTGTDAGNCNQVIFRSVFVADRMVRLHAQNGMYFYARVASAACAGAATGVATVTLQDPVPNQCNMDGGWIAPVNTLLYRVVNADANAGEDDNQGRTTVLRRLEVRPESRETPLVATVGADQVRVEDRSLLDYVVRFKVDFLMMLNDQRVDNRISHVPMTQLEWQNTPQRIRGAIIDVAVRTPYQEVDFTQDVSRAAFKLYQGTGAARVRRMRAELLLPNLANRNLL